MGLKQVGKVVQINKTIIVKKTFQPAVVDILAGCAIHDGETCIIETTVRPVVVCKLVVCTILIHKTYVGDAVWQHGGLRVGN